MESSDLNQVSVGWVGIIENRSFIFGIIVIFIAAILPIMEIERFEPSKQFFLVVV